MNQFPTKYKITIINYKEISLPFLEIHKNSNLSTNIYILPMLELIAPISLIWKIFLKSVLIYKIFDMPIISKTKCYCGMEVDSPILLLF